MQGAEKMWFVWARSRRKSVQQVTMDADAVGATRLHGMPETSTWTVDMQCVQHPSFAHILLKLEANPGRRTRSVIYAYTYSVRANEQTPGCSDAAARSRRLRLQRSCERCVQKFRRRTQRSAGSPTSRQQQQKDQPQQKNPKKNASTDTRKRLDASKVQRRSGRSTSARTATRRRTAAFALARFRSQGIAASSFVFDMATSCVRSPMLAPAVARRSSQRKRREEYRANTRSLMEKHAQQLSG